MLSTIIIVRILTCIQGDFRFRHYFAAAARKISINGGGGGEVGGGGGNWELYPGLESFHRGRCYWLWWKTVPFADGAGEEGLLPVRGLQAGSRYVAWWDWRVAVVGGLRVGLCGVLMATCRAIRLLSVSGAHWSWEYICSTLGDCMVVTVHHPAGGSSLYSLNSAERCLWQCRDPTQGWRTRGLRGLTRAL